MPNMSYCRYHNTNLALNQLDELLELDVESVANLSDEERAAAFKILFKIANVADALRDAYESDENGWVVDYASKFEEDVCEFMANDEN